MKVAIIGAGISGCTAYLQLQKHIPDDHHQITIYEAYSTVENASHKDWQNGTTHSSTLVVGGGLGIGPNGLHVLQRLDPDLVRTMVRNGYAISHGNMKNKHGRLLARLNTTADAALSPGPRPTHVLGCSRHAAWRALRARIPDDVVVTRKIAAVAASPDCRNVITFVDGSPSVEADLVIGADGLKSTARRALFPEAVEDPYPPQYECVCSLLHSYSIGVVSRSNGKPRRGLVGIGGFIPADQVRDQVEPGSMNFILSGNGFFGYFFANSDTSAPDRASPCHVSEPGSSLTWWSTYSVDQCPDPKTLDMQDVTRQLHERHGSWDEPVIKAVLRSLRVDSMYPTWTVPSLPTWYRDGVVLVGDAAHALPPSSGQGASQALEDVEALVLLLRHYLRREAGEVTGANEAVRCKKAITDAAGQYEKLRRPHVEGILQRAKRAQGSKRTMSWVEEYVMYGFMWVMGESSSTVC